MVRSKVRTGRPSSSQPSSIIPDFGPPLEDIEEEDLEEMVPLDDDIEEGDAEVDFDNEREIVSDDAPDDSES